MIVCTGGASEWKTKEISSNRNQIYRIHDGKMEREVSSLTSKPMTNPDTLTTFIRWTDKNYPGNRRILIFSDHGGSEGFGWDERYRNDSPMSLGEMKNALEQAGVKFDFVGFDACLLGTLEMGLMLSDYADYMIAAEGILGSVSYDDWHYTEPHWD